MDKKIENENNPINDNEQSLNSNFNKDNMSAYEGGAGVMVDAIRHMVVLGPEDCSKTKLLFSNIKSVSTLLGLNIDCRLITDMEEITGYGIKETPALVVNNLLISTGKVLSMSDIENVINQF